MVDLSFVALVQDFSFPLSLKSNQKVTKSNQVKNHKSPDFTAFYLVNSVFDSRILLFLFPPKMFGNNLTSPVPRKQRHWPLPHSGNPLHVS